MIAMVQQENARLKKSGHSQRVSRVGDWVEMRTATRTAAQMVRALHASPGGGAATADSPSKR
jgi:hypothetical protein